MQVNTGFLLESQLLLKIKEDSLGEFQQSFIYFRVKSK
jgi:hypothetical protein